MKRRKEIGSIHIICELDLFLVFLKEIRFLERNLFNDIIVNRLAVFMLLENEV